MKPTCMIKSHPKGIALVLDDTCEFEGLVMNICQLFAESRDFFGEGDLILSIEGRQLSAAETLMVIEAIELNSGVHIPLILDESEIRDVRTIGALDRFYFDKVDKHAKIHRGNVNMGDHIESDAGVVVIGDVKKGGKVTAAGTVVVIGKLEGDVKAGEPDDNNAAIIAGKFLAKTATIGGVTREVNIKYRRFGAMKDKGEPVVVKLLNGYFHAEPLSSGLATQDDLD